MPRGKVPVLIWNFQTLKGDIGTKVVQENEHSFFFSDSAGAWEEDLFLMQELLHSAPPNAGALTELSEFAGAVRRGLQNDPTVDWIARVADHPRLSERYL
jgi:hypothetical protein